MRQHVVTVIAATVAAVSISFAVAQATTSPTARDSASTRDVVRELRKNNKELQAIHKAIGESPHGNVNSLLLRICAHTNTANSSATCY